MNISKSLLAVLFCIISFGNGINAQQLHTPQEVEQYMKKSTIPKSSCKRKDRKGD